MRERCGMGRLVERVELAAVAAKSRLAAARERLSGDEDGQTTMEYVMIIGLIAAIIIAIFLVILWPNLKPTVENLMQRIKHAIGGGDVLS